MGEANNTRTLADIIMEKIRQKEAQLSASEEAKSLAAKFEPKVIEVYRGVGKVLKTYTAGKIPKAFKIIPSLTDWESILYFTNPDEWSPQATYKATKIFASNLNIRMAQRFYNMILFPSIRNDISENNKLNYHLYRALKKSLYKAAAFYKGILLPLCESKTCTLKEAVIVGSVMTKVSIPVLHSAAALLRMADMSYSGSTSYFIRILLDKKYSLPFRVIDALVCHFVSFTKETRPLPVLWHQSLLSFVQHYKGDLTAEQNEGLQLLIKDKNHPLISDEIRRELLHSQNRGDNVQILPSLMTI